MDFLRAILGKRAKGEEKQLFPAAREERFGSSEEISFRVGRGTDIGRMREQNEDCFFTLECALKHADEPLPFGLFIVADGMGGHKKGEKASSLATRVVADRIIQEIYLPLLLDEEQSTRQPINEVLVEAVNAASLAVYERVPEAGTTLTSAMILGNTAYIAHVGDSRAYFIKRGSIRQLTQDHSVFARLVELGQVSPEEAANHPQRNVLYRALGHQTGGLEVDIYSQALPTESHLLLCSDGLWSMVPESEIANITVTSLDPQKACACLIEAANKRGGEDNITVILISMA